MSVQQEVGLICFSGGPLAHGVYKLPDTAANALPDLDKRARLVYLRAGISNAGVVYVGGSTLTSTLTVTNQTTGMPLQAGEWFPFGIPAADMESWYVKGTAADLVHWMVLG